MTEKSTDPRRSTDPEISTDPATLERELERRRTHLAGTLDELSARLKPAAIAQRSAGNVRQKLSSATTTENGDLRTERLAALLGAVIAVLAVMLVTRHRRSSGGTKRWGSR